MIEFEINYRPFSLNRAWRVGKGGHIYKTKEAKEWEKAVFYLLPRRQRKFLEKIKKGPLGLQVHFYCKKAKKFDLDNQLKLLIDILQAKYGFNDRNIWYIEAIKFESEEEKIKGKLFVV